MNPGCRPNTFRGGGCYFGPDVTDSFIKRTGIQYIVRSHQCFPEGWQQTHSGRVITIFSSVDYYGLQSNDGVYLQLDLTRDHSAEMNPNSFILAQPIEVTVTAKEQAKQKAPLDEPVIISSIEVIARNNSQSCSEVK